MSWHKCKFRHKGGKFMSEKRYKNVAKRWRQETFGKPSKISPRRCHRVDVTFVAIDLNGNPVANFNMEEEVKDFIENNRNIATRYEQVAIGRDTTFLNSSPMRESCL